MDDTLLLIVQVISPIVASLIGLVSGIVAYQARRDSNQQKIEADRLRVRMAEIEAARVTEKGDIDNTANLINVIQQVVLGLKPSTDALKDASVTMENTSAVMGTLVTITQEALTEARANRTTTGGAIKLMAEKAGERDRQMEILPERVRDEMAQDLDKIPRAVEEALAPKIEALKMDVGELIRRLDEIPNRTNELIRAELADLRAMINTRLIEIARAANGTVQDDPPEPGESDPAIQQPIETGKEESNG